MEEEIAKFSQYLKGEKNVSPHTLRSYSSDLNDFMNFLQKEKTPLEARYVDHLTIRRFLASLQRRGLSHTTTARKLATLRSFFRFLCREEYLEVNPALGRQGLLLKGLILWIENKESFKSHPRIRRG